MKDKLTDALMFNCYHDFINEMCDHWTATERQIHERLAKERADIYAEAAAHGIELPTSIPYETMMEYVCTHKRG